MTYPTAGLLGGEFSVAFWYKLNGTPKRGGILSISRPNSGTATVSLLTAPGSKDSGFSTRIMAKMKTWVLI